MLPRSISLNVRYPLSRVPAKPPCSRGGALWILELLRDQMVGAMSEGLLLDVSFLALL